MLNKATDATPYTIAAQTFTCNGDGCYAKDCKIRLATYLLKMDIFNALAAKYIQVPLIFPIQTVQIKDFTNDIPVGNTNFTTANTLALKHCDAMFVVFKDSEYARTCFDNPFITYQFNVDGKFYPREQCNTYEDERFMNNTLDALNINSSLLSSISEDLRTSLQPYSILLDSSAVGAISKRRYWSLGDYSNFMIGIPRPLRHLKMAYNFFLMWRMIFDFLRKCDMKFFELPT